MDNQHRLIDGYRELEIEDISDINNVKRIERKLLDYLGKLEQFGRADGRWLAIARTDLQKGFMSLIRSVAKPEGDR